MKYPSAISNLINLFSELPSVGPRTAERYVFYLLNQQPEKLQKFIQNLALLQESVKPCQSCNTIAESVFLDNNGGDCQICSRSERDNNFLCIVSDARNILSIETTDEYQGFYFCLGGVINVLEEATPAKLPINRLLNQIKKRQTKEIILALDPTLEGETTIMYLIKTLLPYNLKITRLARGLPIGATLEYADELTIANALKYRNIINS